MKDVIELPDYPPYAVDDKLNIYNLNTERKLKKDEDGNVKIKKNGKTVTLNVDKYCKEHDFYNFSENLINNNIIYNEPYAKNVYNSDKKYDTNKNKHTTNHWLEVAYKDKSNKWQQKLKDLILK